MYVGVGDISVDVGVDDISVDVGVEDSDTVGILLKRV